MKNQLTHSALFIDRELSWLDFNDRVLQEAEDDNVPLLERIKFLGIFSNNQDEFFRVRVASLKRIVKYSRKSEYELNKHFHPKLILEEINRRVISQQIQLARIYNHLLSELKKENIFIINEKEVVFEEHKDFIKSFFNDKLRTYVFPIIMKNFNSASILRDKSIYLAVLMRDTSNTSNSEYALMEVPAEQLSRFVVLPEIDGKQYVMYIDDIIRYCLPDIFKNFKYDEFTAYTIKFTRDSELEMDSDISKSFMEKMSASLKQRKSGNPVRFVADRNMPDNMLKYFYNKIGLSKNDSLVQSGRYHNFKDLMSFPDMGKKHLLYKKIHPTISKRLENATSIFDEVKKKDILLSFPHQSFKYIIDFLREASIDPNVKTISMTIYRIGKNSNVINALINAARNRKKVIVFMELQARFDEENNIKWSTKLQEEGVYVIQSIPGLKVHSKLILIERKEGSKKVYYTNIGTGNFNEDTAKLYTDINVITANQKIGAEVAHVFEMFEASYRNFSFNYLAVSPMGMRPFINKMIDKLIDAAKKGEEAHAIIKLNSIVDEKIATQIYNATENGVKFDIICRGACILQPINENINIISIVGRNLEHSRVFLFKYGKNEEVFISSADWMKRNLDRRIEVLSPVLDADAAETLKQILYTHLKDNVKARYVNGDKNNMFVKDDKDAFKSQIEVYKLIEARNDL